MTTKADTSVKWFHSEMADAPVLSGQAGKLIELLDACLINGFSVRTPDNIVVADGVATVSIGAGNPYEKHAVVVISGASSAALNAEWRIATSSATSFTFTCPGVASGAVTGASVKRAGAGWGKPFSDTNVAVYQSLDPNSTQLYLRVNDTNARYTRVRGYEQMTDANVGTGLFPTLAQQSETLCTWLKSTTANTTARSWALVSDGSFFWFLPRGSSSEGAALQHFGDIRTFVTGDRYHATIVGHAIASPTSNGHEHPCATMGDTGRFRYIARGVSQAGSSATFNGNTLGVTGTNFNAYGGPSAYGAHGSPIIGGPVFVQPSTALNSDIRGILPGVRAAIYVETLPNVEVIEVQSEVFLKTSAASAGVNPGGVTGVAFFDIKGPWR